MEIKFQRMLRFIFGLMTIILFSACKKEGIREDQVVSPNSSHKWGFAFQDEYFEQVMQPYVLHRSVIDFGWDFYYQVYLTGPLAHWQQVALMPNGNFMLNQSYRMPGNKIMTDSLNGKWYLTSDSLKLKIQSGQSRDESGNTRVIGESEMRFSIVGSRQSDLSIQTDTSYWSYIGNCDEGQAYYKGAMTYHLNKVRE